MQRKVTMPDGRLRDITASEGKRRGTGKGFKSPDSSWYSYLPPEAQIALRNEYHDEPGDSKALAFALPRG